MLVTIFTLSLEGVDYLFIVNLESVDYLFIISLQSVDYFVIGQGGYGYLRESMWWGGMILSKFLMYTK